MLIENDYRQILKSKLTERGQDKRGYSLRSFAKDLGISVSQLSDVLNRKKGLSLDKAKSIASKLGFTESEQDQFCLLVRASDSRSRIERIRAAFEIEQQDRIKEPMYQLHEVTFQVISTWYHYALMELTTLRNFKYDIQWMSKKLGISISETREAIQRLKSLGLLIEENNTLTQTRSNITTTDGVPSAAVRQFNRELLEKAIEALSLYGVDDRYISSLIVAINKNDLAKYVEKIKEFRDQINDMAESNEAEKNEVFCLGLQMYPISKPEDRA